MPVAEAVALAEDLLDARHQLAGIGRMAHVMVGSKLDADDAVHRVLVAQQSHRRHPRPLDGRDHLKTPLVGQPGIHHRHVELHLLRDLTRMPTRPGRQDLPTLIG